MNILHCYNTKLSGQICPRVFVVYACERVGKNICNYFIFNFASVLIYGFESELFIKINGTEVAKKIKSVTAVFIFVYNCVYKREFPK